MSNIVNARYNSAIDGAINLNRNGGIAMNWDQIQGSWRQFRGQVKQKWGKLTDDDLDYISGKREELVGRLQKRYGIAKDEAERQVDEFQRRS